MDLYIVNSNVEENDDEENILIDEDDEFSTYFTDQKINVPESDTVGKASDNSLHWTYYVTVIHYTDDNFCNRE